MKKISEILFFISYNIYLITNILNASFYSIYISPYMKIIMVFCIILLVFKEMFYKKLSKKEFLLLILCAILFSVLALHVNGLAMVPLFFFMYSARDIDFEKVTKNTIIYSAITLVFVIISAYAGIITNYVDITLERTRVYLGFRYALFPQMILFNITACCMYIYRKKVSIMRGILLILINYIMFSYTNSRLSFYLSVLLIVFVTYLQIKPNFFEKHKIISFLLIFSFPICAVSSIYVTTIYDSSNNTLWDLDVFLGGRLSKGKNSFQQYNINLFGHKTEYIGNGLDKYGQRDMLEHNYVDCLYVNMLEKYGILFNIVFLSLLTYAMYRSLKEKKYILFAILIFYALHGIIDDLEIYLYYNAFWLAISSYFRNKRLLSE